MFLITRFLNILPHTALICGDESLSYSDLDKKSSDLAKFLVGREFTKR